MRISISPLTPDFVGEVSGIDASRPLSAEEVAAVESGMDRYAVLILHDQVLTDEQQMAFSANFGPLLDGRNPTMQRDELRLDPAFADVSNIDKEGRILSRDDRRRLASSLGNRLWHTDATFRVIPARYSFLSAKVVPPEGGNTEFADMRAAYDALDAETKAEVEDLICAHSLMFSRAKIGFEYSDEEKAKMVPALQRLVRRHPVTGRKSLCLSAHIGRVLDISVPEAMVLVNDLMEHATQRQFVYSHRWRAGDIVIWDNRCTMHRVRKYDDLKYPRDLRRTTTLAEGPTVEQQAA